MKTRSLSLLTALAALALSGCFTLNASLPGTLRSDVEEDKVEKVGSFEKEVNHWFIPFGIGEAPSSAFRAALLEQAKEKGADGVANLRFEAYNGCFDLLISGVTCAIVRPRTFKLSGDLVRIKKAPLAGKRPKAVEPVKVSGEQITVEAPVPEPDVVEVAY